MLRSFAALLLVALARALAVSLAAWGASGWAGGLEFLFVWTVLLLPLQGALALLELPLLLGLLGGDPRRRAALILGATGLVWGLLGAGLVRTHLGGLGAWGVVATCLGGALAGGLLPARKPSEEPEPIERRWTLGGAALLLVVVGLLLLVDPEGRYNERYQDNRLSAEDLARPPAVAGDPDQFSDLQLARALARTWMATHDPQTLRWSWEEAVAMEGLLAYGRRAKDPAPRAFAAAWIEAHTAEALETPLWADACAPAAVVLQVSEQRAGHPIVARVLEYLRHDAKRTSRGALSHTGDLVLGLLPAQAWVDSLFMHGVFLNRLAKLDHAVAPWAREAALELARAMVAHLQDAETGLFRHAALELGPLELKLPVEPMFWARGNAWAAWFLVDLLAPPATPDPDLLLALRKLLGWVRSAQDRATGLYRTDLLGAPDADNPVETSASALLVAAFERAQRLRLLAREEGDGLLLKKARGGVRTRFRWTKGHPTLEGTSTGTSPGFRRSYRSVPLDENVGHGVGAVLLLLSGEM